MLKSCAGISNNNIPSDTFKQYFESVNNPSDPFFHTWWRCFTFYRQIWTKWV